MGVDEGNAKKRQVVELPDGYNGSTCKFFADPVEVDRHMVKLQCAEPGLGYLINWVRAEEVTAALKKQRAASAVSPVDGPQREDADRYEAARVRKVDGKTVADAPIKFGSLSDALAYVAGSPVSENEPRPWIRDCTEPDSRHQFLVIGGKAQGDRECVIRQLDEQHYGVFYVRNELIADCVGDYKGPLAREHAVEYAERLGYASAPVVDLDQKVRRLPFSIKRLIDDEITYARQKTFSPSYLAANREPALRAYFEANQAAAEAFTALLQAEWQKKPDVVPVHRDTPALIAAANLERAFGDEHPDFDREAHSHEVSRGDTRLWDYWEWVVHQVEADGRAIEEEVARQANCRCR